MGFAIPDRVVARGHAHEAVQRAALVVGRSGWRVSSIYRPDAQSSPNHYAGRALDVTPLVYQRGGFGRRTCGRLLKILQDSLPQYTYEVIAEDDHLHVNYLGPNESGRPSGRVGIYTPTGVDYAMHDNPLLARLGTPNPNSFMPDRPMGDPGAELGDIEDGDPDLESGDVEWGEPQTHIVDADDRCIATGEPVQVIAESGDPEEGDALERGGPRRRKRRRAVVGRRRQSRGRHNAPVRRGSSKSSAFYEGYSGLSQRISGPVLAGARMRRAECAALSAAILLNPAFTPQVFPFAVVGATLQLDIDSSLSTPLGIGVLFDWTGDLIQIVVPLLSAQPAVFTVTRIINGVSAAYNLQLKTQTNGASLYQINANTYAATPRITNDRLTTAAVATGNHRITISGLNVALFSATLQHFIPGDSSAEKVLKALGAL